MTETLALSSAVAPAAARPPSYVARAFSLRTGRMIRELPLANIAAQVRLGGGRFTANLPLSGRDLDDCRSLLGATHPNLTTIVLTRDNVIMGEWWITNRRRSNGPDPVQVTGYELPAWVRRVAIDGFTKQTSIRADQLGYLLALHALARPPGIECTALEPAASGADLVPEAEYGDGTEYVGKIIDELGGGVNGFDWWAETTWDAGSATPKVQREIRFAWPRRGRVLPSIIDLPRRTPSQSGVRLDLDEDGEQVAATVYMTGTGEGDTQLVARGRNLDLVGVYPALDLIESRASYTQQALLDAQAAAAAAGARTPARPTTVLLRADSPDLPLGTYTPGDVVSVRMEACENFPDGMTGTVRVLGYTLRPPSGGTEMVEVEISTALDGGGVGAVYA